jgi:hypothetical protein
MTDTSAREGSRTRTRSATNWEIASRTVMRETSGHGQGLLGQARPQPARTMSASWPLPDHRADRVEVR